MVDLCRLFRLDSTHGNSRQSAVSSQTCFHSSVIQLKRRLRLRLFFSLNAE